MKRELLYSFISVLISLVLSFVLFLFIGNDNSRNAMLLINIIVAALFTYLYYSKNTSASAVDFSLMLLAMSVFLNLIVTGILLQQGLTFFFSIYFWIQTLERITIPFIYEKYFWKKPEYSNPEK